MLSKLTLPALAILAAPFCFPGIATTEADILEHVVLEHVGENCISVAKTSKDQKTYPCSRVYQTLSDSRQSLTFQFIGKDISMFWITNLEPLVLDDGTKVYRLQEVIANVGAAPAIGTTTPFHVRGKGKDGDFCMVTPTINSVLAKQQGNTKPMPKVACLFNDRGSQIASGILFAL